MAQRSTAPKPKCPVEVRILPMDLSDFDNCDSIEDVQRRFFCEDLPSGEDGRYLYRTRGLQAKRGAAVLFQCEGRIIATAILNGSERFKKPTKDGYEGCLNFDKKSIKIFDPIDAAAMRKIWPTFKQFSQVRQKLRPTGYPEFERQLRGVRSPKTPLSVQEVERYHAELELQVARARRDPQARRKRLASASKKPQSVTALTTVFDRNPDVIAEVIERAAGVCEKCGEPAPFLRRKDGSPYLEVHHKVTLANGGEDSVENAIAICPNCHRKLHYG